jgi:hypothetical protein
MPAIQLSDADKHGMSPEEIEALTSEGAEAALGAKPADKTPEKTEGESAATEVEGGDVKAATTEGATAAGAEGEKKPAEQGIDAETLAEIAEGDRQAPPTQYKAELSKDFKERREGLLKEKADLHKQLMDGEIDADEFASKDATIATKLEDLTAERVRVETLQSLNEQNMHNAIAAECQRVLAASKKAGEIDYIENKKAAAHFDASMEMLLADPDNAGRPISEIADMAHGMVCLRNGIDRKPTAAPAPQAGQQGAATAAHAAGPAAAPASPQAGPRTLAGMPAAAAAQIGDDLAAQFATLEGEEAELFLAKLPPAKVEALLRSAH